MPAGLLWLRSRGEEEEEEEGASALCSAGAAGVDCRMRRVRLVTKLRFAGLREPHKPLPLGVPSAVQRNADGEGFSFYFLTMDADPSYRGFLQLLGPSPEESCKVYELL